MQLIGATAGLDALLALAAWIVVQSRRTQLEQEGGTTPQTVRHFSRYLMYTCIFLALTAISILLLTGTVQMLVVMISDLILWISLALFILLATVGRSTGTRNALLVLFVVFAALGSLYQLAGLVAIDLALGSIMTYILSQMAPLMMYAVWIPSALRFFVTAAATQSTLVRTRALMLGGGLLLITFSWAFRLLTAQPSFMTVSLASLLGFALLLGGVIYRKEQHMQPLTAAPTR